MNKFLKLATIPAAFLIVGLTTGCNKSTAKVALITDVGDIDDGSFNQSSWEAIQDYAKDHPVSHDYYRPFADSEFARRLAIQQAVAKGAEIIICPGFKFAPALSQAQLDYPKVHFVLLDSTVNNFKRNNTVCANYAPEISGFMAGYAIAQDYLEYDVTHGEKKIKDKYKYGYCGGMSYASVYTFGYGFVQGAVLGTKDFLTDKNIEDRPELDFNYNYAGVFAQDDAAAARVKDWYADGTKAVFACGGKLYQSVTEGVKDYNIKNGYSRAEEGKLDRNAARWVGVDTDQYKGLQDVDDKKTIITSALKGLHPTIITALEKHFAGDDGWNEIGDTSDGDVEQHFSTKKAAEDYLNDDREFVGTKPLFSGYETKIEEIKEGEYKIMMRTKNTNDEFFEYKVQGKKAWPLALNSKFGASATAQDYVGLPVDGLNENDKLKGFFNFTKKQYDTLKNKINTTHIIYNKGGNELYKDGVKPSPDKPFVKEGYPTFMSSSTHYTIPGSGETFNEKYFENYPEAKIVVNVI